MKNFLEAIDIFGIYFNFTVFNKDKHRTFIGGILTILTICCTIASTFYFCRDFYFRTNPKTDFDRIQSFYYPKYTINSSNFVFGFRVEDSQLNFFNESSFFQFKVIYNNSTMTKNNTNGHITEYDAPVIYLNFSKCEFNKNLKYFNLKSSDYVDYTNFYCIDFSNNNSIGGYWTANFTQYIDIQLVYCNPNYPNCKSKNDTETFFKTNKLYLTLMTLKYFIDLTNYEIPLMNYLSYSYIQIDPNLSKKVNFFMTPGLVTSHDVKNYIVDETLTHTSFNVDYWTLDTMIYSDINNKITLTRIYFTNYLDRFNRTYVKLPDLIPIIVSMHKIISVLFSAIATFYNKFDWTNRMLNELFDFSDHHETKSIKINERRSIIKMNMMKTDNQDQIIELEESVKYSENKLDVNDAHLSDSRVGNFNKDIENSNTIKKLRAPILIKFKDFIKNTKQSELNDNLIHLLNEKTDFSYHLPFKTYINTFCCVKIISERKKKIYNIYNKGNKILKEKTDIVSFMKIIDEINKMKYVLFNQVQSLCFNFIRKPSLIEGQTEDNYSKFFNYIKGDESTQKKDIVSYFINQSKSQFFSQYNKAFLDIIDNDMKLVIEIIKKQNN